VNALNAPIVMRNVPSVIVVNVFANMVGQGQDATARSRQKVAQDPLEKSAQDEVLAIVAPAVVMIRIGESCVRLIRKRIINFASSTSLVSPCIIEQKQGQDNCKNQSEVCSIAESHERFTYGFVEELDAEIKCLVRIVNKHGIQCDSYFGYEVIDHVNFLTIQAVECEPANYYAIFGSISLITVLLGLLIIGLILWCLRMKDSREYARFLEDQANSLRQENPIYRDPVGRYEVPKALSAKFDENPFAS